jgi:hypothetical protein
VYRSNVEIIANTEICEASISVCFMSEGQITPQTTVIFGRVATERNASLLVGSEIDNGHCDALLLDERKERLGNILEDFLGRFAENIFLYSYDIYGIDIYGLSQTERKFHTVKIICK